MMSRILLMFQNTLFNREFFKLKWLLFIVSSGVLSGSASALFLSSLHWVTHFREMHLSVVFLLPLGGFIIGLSYHYFGKEVVKGNNLILDEYYHPKKTIPLKMAPLVLLGTLITHLFGGSAGREGTSVQMGTALSDQFSKYFKISLEERKTLLIMGVSGGFASVFGTPVAGAIFSIEILGKGKDRFHSLLPALVVAFIADYTCHFWNVGHTSYAIFEIPPLTISLFLHVLAVGIIFGFAAWLFIQTHHLFNQVFQKLVAWPPLRPLIGGGILAVIFYFTDTYRFMGLGIPTIESAFVQDLAPYDFMLKILFTSFTLAAGFKGGEVTPLFFIGATLGNAMFWFIPLPLSLLAAMGFVAVFSSATNTPVSSTLMGMELFGYEAGVYLALACFTGYLFSGTHCIYSSQKPDVLKIYMGKKWQVISRKLMK